jgi:hypothetical protein
MNEIVQGEKFSLEHSYSDFRWFRPNRHLKLLVTTGRFQQVHYGHLLYLRKGLLRAIETNSRFRVITGPSDNEYRTHPDIKRHTRVLCSFSTTEISPKPPSEHPEVVHRGGPGKAVLDNKE